MRSRQCLRGCLRRSKRMRRRGADADRYERLDQAFHARVRQGFRDIAAADPKRCVMLDASGDIEAVHTAIMTAVWTRLAGDQ